MSGTVLAIIWVFNTFITTGDFEELAVEVYYDRYYDNADRLLEAQEDGRNDRVQELQQRLERLRAKICKIEPDWSKCD